MKKVLPLLTLLCCLTVSAQAGSVDEKLFESLHGHASFNVVLTVIGIILAGLFITLWRLDRKVSKLEKEFQNRK
jgi:hypothetical protein